ncbi:MAG: hypothetical protein AAF846_15910 [Chloroflexota bacterium]
MFQHEEKISFRGIEVRKGLTIDIPQANYRLGGHHIGHFKFSVAPSYSLLYPKIKPMVLQKRWSTFSIIGFEFPYEYSNKVLGDHEISFRINGDEESLKVACLLEENGTTDYENQVTARLDIHPNILVSDWDTHPLADWWVALCSLAIGRYIEWTRGVLPRNDEFFYEERWMYRLSRSSRQNFKSPIITPHLSSKNLGDLQDFVSQAIETILNSGHNPEYWGKYLLPIITYVEYCSLRVTRFGQARLVTTLTEELLGIWGREHNLKNLVQAIPKSNLNDEKPRMSNLRHRLYAFFTYYGYDPFSSNRLQRRIKAFVGTRNSIAHAGTFECNNPDPKVRAKQIFLFSHQNNAELHEYENALMMLPLMLFCILEYKDKYNDFVYGDNQYWIP